MVITRSDVDKIAKLSRLALTEEEKDKFTGQLDKIFEFVQELNKVDTTGVEATSHAIPVYNVLREDKVVPFTNQQGIINNAPQSDGRAFVVPKIV